ncbi:hypothetical protein MNBD_ALPHA04-634 [hydrothermal vent metagenome]|uniref:FAD-binding domain-containing protein n=1 Tax=hydrothermal vent metagenome TaxID=652676 RepID=A0A3B0RGK5_9ZZZZ
MRKDAGNIQRNIAIVGCGPGGLACALFLVRQGHEVTLFERFSAPKPLGSGLLIQPTGQQVLDDLNLLDEAEKLGAPVEQLYGISVSKSRRALDMRYEYTGDGSPALGIHRASLFDSLMEVVRLENISVIVDSELVDVVETASSISPIFADKDTARTFDLLIDASGAHSPLAQGKNRKLGFGAFWTTVDWPEYHEIRPKALDQRYENAGKMAGIMPVGINPATGNQGAAIFWSERPENEDAVRAAGIEKFKDEFYSLWPEARPFVSQIKTMDALTMAVYDHRTGRTNSSARVFHVGDSWHCTSPQLGQGANMALMDASALAQAIGGAPTIENIARRYRRLRSFHVVLYQILSAIFTPLYQSDSRILPWTRDMLIHHFARLPLVRGLIARTVSGMLGNSRAD